MELITRYETPLFLRFTALGLVFTVLLCYAIFPAWVRANRVLVGLPFQRFEWASETFLNSPLNRISSIICSSLAFSIFIYAHYLQDRISFTGVPWLDFTLLSFGILLLLLFKLLALKVFFALHAESDAGTLIIDYQYAYNLLLSLLLMVVILLDLFYFRLSNPLYITASILIGLLFLLRLMGSIMLLLNKFTYPIISLFIYLCAFEIVPMLVIAKVILVKS